MQASLFYWKLLVYVVLFCVDRSVGYGASCLGPDRRPGYDCRPDEGIIGACCVKCRLCRKGYGKPENLHSIEELCKAPCIPCVDGKNYTDRRSMGKCRPCLDCDLVHRTVAHACVARRKGKCGGCLPGYETQGRDVTFCRKKKVQETTSSSTVVMTTLERVITSMPTATGMPYNRAVPSPVVMSTRLLYTLVMVLVAFVCFVVIVIVCVHRGHLVPNRCTKWLQQFSCFSKVVTPSVQETVHGNDHVQSGQRENRKPESEMPLMQVNCGPRTSDKTNEHRQQAVPDNPDMTHGMSSGSLQRESQDSQGGFPHHQQRGPSDPQRRSPEFERGFQDPEGRFSNPQRGIPDVLGGFTDAQRGFPDLEGGSLDTERGLLDTQLGSLNPQRGFPAEQRGFPAEQRGFPAEQGGFPAEQGGFPDPQHHELQYCATCFLNKIALGRKLTANGQSVFEISREGCQCAETASSSSTQSDVDCSSTRVNPDEAHTVLNRETRCTCTFQNARVMMGSSSVGSNEETIPKEIGGPAEPLLQRNSTGYLGDQGVNSVHVQDVNSVNVQGVNSVNVQGVNSVNMCSACGQKTNLFLQQRSADSSLDRNSLLSPWSQL